LTPYRGYKQIDKPIQLEMARIASVFTQYMQNASNSIRNDMMSIFK